MANGTATTKTIEAAGIPGARSIWADPLYEGPVPGGLSDGELVDVRTQFLSGAADTASARSDAARHPVNDLRQWRAAIARAEAYDELVFWFEHDLFDQLNLIQALSFLNEHGPAVEAVSLICIGSFPGRTNFKGLGELTPDELAPLFEARRSVTASQYALARRAWDAFRAPTPEPLDALRRDDTSALPYLGAAITRFLQEYPWTRDGLSRTERRLLEVASGGPISLADAFPRMHDGEQAYYVTDLSLAALAEGLSRTSPPILALDPSPRGNGNVFRSRVTLTDTGRAMLAGQLDRVETCGIDRWLGGVHLQGDGTMWRWNNAEQTMSRG